MANNYNAEDRARVFISEAKDCFSAQIPRDKVLDIGISECVPCKAEEGEVFALAGSVGTLSPTGKSKTYAYKATVKVKEDGACSVVSLKVLSRE